MKSNLRPRGSSAGGDGSSSDESVADRLRYDRDTGTYHVTCDRDRDVAISTTIALAVEAIQECDDGARLVDVVDPDALDDLFAPYGGRDRTTGTVSFAFAGCEVTVDATGTIALDPQ